MKTILERLGFLKKITDFGLFEVVLLLILDLDDEEDTVLSYLLKRGCNRDFSMFSNLHRHLKLMALFRHFSSKNLLPVKAYVNPRVHNAVECHHPKKGLQLCME